jgi:hypothetical protein
MQTLKEALQDWTDIDIAGYHLAQCLGLMAPNVNFQVRAKHVFWSDNLVGNMLGHILEELVQEGILEKRDEPDYQYRWNPAFRGSWE